MNFLPELFFLDLIHVEVFSVLIFFIFEYFVELVDFLVEFFLFSEFFQLTEFENSLIFFTELMERFFKLLILLLKMRLLIKELLKLFCKRDEL